MGPLVQALDRTLNVSLRSNLLAVLRERDILISYSGTASRCVICRRTVVEGRVLDAGPAAASSASSQIENICN